MKAEVLAWCRREALFAPGDRVVCGVSGGADSMALLWCLRSLAPELSITVSAAHFNHRLRGEESDRDEAFVRAFCAAHGIALTVGAAEPGAYTAGQSIETAARAQRYAFFDGLNCERLATAHSADDNTETVLQHFLRGSGLRGLCGIPPRRGRYVRPLLSVSRAQILDYLQKQQLAWVEDSTNATDDCLRNRLRHQVLPLLRAEAPDLSRRITGLTALLRADDRLLDSQAAALLPPETPGAPLHIPTLLAAPDALQKRALRLYLRRALPQDVHQRHILDLQALLVNPCPSARLSLPGGLTARRRYDLLELAAGEPPSGFPPTALCVPGETPLPGLGMRVRCTVTENFQKNTNTPFTFAVKCDKIAASIPLLRPRRPGDAMTLPNGRRVTLKKLFIDRKIPRAERDRLPVLESGGVLLAVAGIGTDPSCVPAAGEAALIIQIEKEEM